MSVEIIDAAWKKQHRSANMLLGCGLFFVAGGMLLTVVSLAFALQRGEDFFIAFGVIISGIVPLIIGIVRKGKLR